MNCLRIVYRLTVEVLLINVRESSLINRHYIDEFHVLLNFEYSVKYLQRIWKNVRKQFLYNLTLILYFNIKKVIMHKIG